MLRTPRTYVAAASAPPKYQEPIYICHPPTLQGRRRRGEEYAEDTQNAFPPSHSSRTANIFCCCCKTHTEQSIMHRHMGSQHRRGFCRRMLVCWEDWERTLSHTTAAKGMTARRDLRWTVVVHRLRDLLLLHRQHHAFYQYLLPHTILSSSPTNSYYRSGWTFSTRQQLATWPPPTPLPIAPYSEGRRPHHCCTSAPRS